MNLIERLFQLRQSGSEAVVSEAEYTDLQARMHVPDGVEDWVFNLIAEWRAAGRVTPLLIMLSGNAGDGKSDLIARLRQRINDDDDLNIVADATHAESPAEDQIGRLVEFFRPFADDSPTPESPTTSLIAMNTGMALSFLQKAEERQYGVSFTRLGAAIRRELGLATAAPDAVPWQFEIVNLDRRSVLSFGEAPGLFDGMLDRLDPNNEDGLLWESGQACEGCAARSSCFVRTNIEMLRLDEVRRNLTEVLWAASQTHEIHLSPRNLWDLLYHVTTSGTQFFAEHQSPCDAISELAGDPVNAPPKIEQRLLYNLLFETPDEYDRGPVLTALADADPLLRVGRHAHATEGAVFNDPASDRDAMRTAAETIGAVSGEGVDPCLAALGERLELGEWDEDARFALARGAVRRARIIGVPGHVADEVADSDVEGYGDLLTAYGQWAPGEAPSEEVRNFGRELIAAINRIFGIELLGQSYFRLDTFSPSTRFPIFVAVDLQTAIEPVMDPDLARHPGWLNAVNFRPAAITLEIRAGGETPWHIRAGLGLYRLFQRVLAGYAASSVDLEAFFGLRYACERLGSSGLDNRELMIASVNDGRLFRLRETVEFGELTLAFEEASS